MRRRAPVLFHSAKFPGTGRHQRGQALVLAVICLLVLCLALFAVFDTGQVVTKKEQLINAADAGAYSVAVEQARALNTAAYFNRAEVANQIAIAQIVSIQSYANYADSMLGRTAAVLFSAGDALDASVVLAEFGAALQELAETLKFLQQGYAGGLVALDKGESVIVTALNALNGIYSVGQANILYTFSVNSGVKTVSKVIHDNTLDADGASHAQLAGEGKVLLGAQLACFDDVKFLCKGPAVLTRNMGYSVRYVIPQQASASSSVKRTWEADRVASVMMKARDLFSSSRNGDIPISPFPLFKIDAVKAGGTDLVDYNRWVAADDLSVEIKIGICHLACWKLAAGTLALGAAAAVPSKMATQGGSSIIKPGISLTEGSGVGDGYHPGYGAGWYSPYDSNLTPPYQGALDNLAVGADLAAHPTDQGSYDTIADLRYATPWQNIVPGDATPRNVAWIASEAPSVNSKFGSMHSSGLQDYNDVAPGKAIQPYRISEDDNNDVGPIFTVYVQQADTKVRTSANIGMTGGDLKLKNKGADQALSAMSTAQVYYDRPTNLDFLRRQDGQRELGNLFEPYWQVRLISTPEPIRLALLGSEMAGL